MVVNWTVPDSSVLHLAWNPIIFRAEVTDDDMKVVTLTVKKGASGDGESVDLKAAVRNGHAEIDVAPIVRGWFDDRLEVTEEQLETKLFYEDRTASVRFRAASNTYTALNGVAQAGEPTYLEYKNGGLVLTGGRMLHYRQFEPHLSVPQIVIIAQNGGTAIDGTVTQAHTAYRVFAKGTQQMQTYLHNLGFQWDISGCKRDVCVRWRNAMGGTDVFVFSDRAYETEKVKSSEYVAPAFDGRPGYPLRTDAARTLKLHATVEDSVEKRSSLRGLAESPCVEVFKTVYEDRTDGYVVVDTARSTWIRCGVENSSISKATDNAHLDYEIELRMPDLNLRTL